MSDIFEWGPPEFTPAQKEAAESAHALLRRAGARADQFGEAKAQGYDWWFLLGSWLRQEGVEALEVGADPRAVEFAHAFLGGDVDLSAQESSNGKVWEPVRFKEPDW